MKPHLLVTIGTIGTAIMLPMTSVARAEAPVGTDQSMRQIERTARADFQNRMREWSRGLGLDLLEKPEVLAKSRPRATTAKNWQWSLGCVRIAPPDAARDEREQHEDKRKHARDSAH